MNNPNYDLHEVTLDKTTQTFKALSDPTRVRILHLLFHKECSVNEIAKTLGLQQSTVSHQLRYLKQLRLIKCRRHKTTLHYSPEDHHIFHLLNQAIEHAKHI